MRFIRSSPSYLLSIAVSAAVLIYASTSLAAEKIVLKYSFLQESIAVADLATLAETGKPSPALDSHLKMAGQSPQAVQQALTKEFKVDPVILDQALNSPLGEAALDKLGAVIHTPTGGADRQALRAALVLSASKSGKVSLLRVIQNYPTQEVQIEGEQLLNAYLQLLELEDQVRKILNLINLF